MQSIDVPGPIQDLPKDMTMVSAEQEPISRDSS